MGLNIRTKGDVIDLLKDIPDRQDKSINFFNKFFLDISAEQRNKVRIHLLQLLKQNGCWNSTSQGETHKWLGIENGYNALYEFLDAHINPIEGNRAETRNQLTELNRKLRFIGSNVELNHKCRDTTPSDNPYIDRNYSDYNPQ